MDLRLISLSNLFFQLDHESLGLIDLLTLRIELVPRCWQTSLEVGSCFGRESWRGVKASRGPVIETSREYDSTPSYTI